MKKISILLVLLLACVVVLSFGNVTNAENSPLDTPNQEVKDLFTAYNKEEYTKQTTIFINSNNEELVSEIEYVFHAKRLPRLELTTHYSEGRLWMEETNSGYKTNGENMDHFKVVDGADKVDSTVKGKTMDQYYTSLADFANNKLEVKEYQTTPELLNPWQKEGEVYYTTDPIVLDAYRLFTAPMWLGTTKDNSNYITYDVASLQVVDGNLVMRLLASTEEGKLLNAPTVTIGGVVYHTFSQAVILHEHEYSTKYDSVNHWQECTLCADKQDVASHAFDNTTGECTCGKDAKYSLISSHAGTAQWDMANAEKISSNAVIHQNVSNVAVDADGNLVDFSLQIQYRGWENNGERTYFYTIKSANGVLTIDNQLGIDPWSHTTFTLSDEHKARLASEEGLDFLVRYSHGDQKLELYMYTNHELVLLHSLKTYYGSMANFYKFKYVLNGTATVNTTTYKVYDSSAVEVFEELGLGYGNGHNYENGVCACGKEDPFTLISSHAGTAQWDMANEEKISSNAVIHQNVSNVAVDADGNLVDFSLQFQYRGWENNGERTYFFTIKSANGVLTLDNQLGISPWSYTTFTLSDEHKERLASAEGLDFFVCYNHSNQKLSLYIITNDEVVKLYEMNTYYGSMANFYKFKYVLTGNATVQTTTYKVSEGFEPHSDLLNK